MPLEHDPARNLNVELDKAGNATPKPTQIINTKRVAVRMPFHPLQTSYANSMCTYGQCVTRTIYYTWSVVVSDTGPRTIELTYSHYRTTLHGGVLSLVVVRT
jgi:hypothetical protein